VCCQVEVFEKGRLLVRMSPTECGVSECGHEVSIRKRLSSPGAFAPWGRKK
jgi:hypothetical protein